MGKNGSEAAPSCPSSGMMAPMVRRLAVAVAVLSIVLQSCTNAVIVPFDPPSAIDPDATYQVITVNGDKFGAKGLVVDDQSVRFKSDKHDYTFPRNEIRSIAKMEYDKSRTFLALTAVAAVATGLIFLIGEMVEALGPAGSAN